MAHLKRFTRYTLIFSILGLLLGGIGTFTAYRLMAPRIPDVESLHNIQLQVPLRIVSRDNKLIALYGANRRIPIQTKDIPEHLKYAVMAAEDADFYKHHGVDIKGTIRAAIRVVLAGGRKVQGGSTITQQVARNFFLSSQKTYTRKITEILTALRIENELSKDQILGLYLNKMFLGHRNYGVGAAAQYYYGKKVKDLTVAESAMLASSFQLPSLVNPLRGGQRALERRNWVLGQMRKRGFIDQHDYQVAIDTPLHGMAFTPPVKVHADYVAEMVRQEATKLIGNEILTDGYTIRTTIDSAKQNAAVKALRKGLLDYTHRHGYQGPEAQIKLGDKADKRAFEDALEPYFNVGGLEPGLVISSDANQAQVYLRNGDTITLDLKAMAWAKPYISHSRFGYKPKAVNDVVKRGDIIRLRQDDEDAWHLEQIPSVEGGLVSMNPENGAIDAMVGGFSFMHSKYNRALMGGSGRQPGSSFKPFIYAASLDHGFTLASIFNDAPVIYKDPSTASGVWTPSNSNHSFTGPVRLRQALYQSKNLVSIRLLNATGIDYTRQYLTRFGFKPSQLPGSLSLALGTASVSPLEMTRANAILANGGYMIKPFAIKSISKSRQGKIYKAHPFTACVNCTERQMNGHNKVVSLATLEDWQNDSPAVLEATTDQEQNKRDDKADEDTEEPQSPRLAPHVISNKTTYMITSVLQDVITKGTGRQALVLKRKDLAGKTGSTNNHHDAWFNGFNHKLASAVWVGFDDYGSLGRGEYGAHAALPIWIDYMHDALADTPEALPPRPAGLTTLKINKHTGLPTSEGGANTVEEIFKTQDVADLRRRAQRSYQQQKEQQALDIF